MQNYTITIPDSDCDLLSDLATRFGWVYNFVFAETERVPTHYRYDGTPFPVEWVPLMEDIIRRCGLVNSITCIKEFRTELASGLLEVKRTFDFCKNVAWRDRAHYLHTPLR